VRVGSVYSSRVVTQLLADSKKMTAPAFVQCQLTFPSTGQWVRATSVEGTKLWPRGCGEPLGSIRLVSRYRHLRILRLQARVKPCAPAVSPCHIPAPSHSSPLNCPSGKARETAATDGSPSLLSPALARKGELPSHLLRPPRTRLHQVRRVQAICRMG
jgi:hypothetical protein